MLVVAILSSVCAISANLLSSRIAAGFGRDIRNKIFKTVEGYSLSEFNKIGTASLITRTTNDVTQVQTVIAMGFRFLLFSPIMCIGGIVMAFTRDKELSVVLAVSIPALLLSMLGVAKFIVPLFKLMQSKIDRLNLVMRESLIGIRVIRAFNKTNFDKQKFDYTNKELTGVSIKANRIMAFMQPLMMIIMNLTSVAIIWFGGVRIGNGDMQIGDMMAFLQYAMQIMMSVIMVAMMYVMVPRAQVSANRINEILVMESDINDPKNPKSASNQKGYVEFDNVTFSYPGAEKPVIENITFSAKPGEVTAIIGGTGSGKSTLINLIPRFYDITDGSIKVNGVDIQEMSQQELRSKIGFVAQGAVLFSGTVFENIRFGKNDATDDEVFHAAKVAQAYDFVSQMPDGFNSSISQGGTNISGGQKQRLSIARAIVRKPEIYIFDDSFSALDFKTDAKLRAALRQETQQSTVLIVAQRISTVMDADRIIVLDNGSISGIGTHKELMESCEIYKEFVSSQLSEGEIA